MAFALVYRLEFINFEENTIRVDISDSTVPIVPGGSLSIPTDVGFNTSGGINRINILVYPGGFFYVGMTFTVAGTASNDGTYTCTVILGTGTVEIRTAEAFTNEYVATGPVVFTDVSTTDPQIIPIQGTGTPLVISTINNDQDKFQPIRSKQAVIQFTSDSAGGLDITTFSAGADNRWYVEITIVGGDTIFLGYLIMSDNQQAFQPDPQIVQLTATDHLGALKDIALVDYNDLNPMGRYRIADLITMALRKTGLSLDLYVTNNLRTGSGQLSINAIFQAVESLIFFPAGTMFFYPGQLFTITGSASNNGTFTVAGVGQGILTIVQVLQTLVDEASVAVVITDTNSSLHMYDVVCMDAKTFEDQIGTCVSCYDTLAKILGEDCWVGQYKGLWRIRRVDEYDNFPIYEAQFDISGNFIAIAAGTDFNISIGAAETRRAALADMLLQFIRPHGVVKETYRFELPLEIPCNVDFSRGDLTATISSGEKHFDLDCWDKLWSNTTTDDPSTAGITFIRRDYINDTEFKRYVVISADPSGHLNFIMSEPIAVNIQDKFNIDFSVRTSTNVGGSGAYTINAIQVRLYGNDGTFWTAHGKKDPTDLLPTWVLSDVTFRTSLGYFYMQGDLSTTDFTDSQSLFNGESAEIPVAGYLRILIFANPEDVTARDTYIDKLSFDYLPLVNGSYQKYTGDFYEVDRLISGYMAKRDNQVYAADSPVQLYKGAMLVPSRFDDIVIINTTFSPPNAFVMFGDFTQSFYVGQRIRIIGFAASPTTRDFTVSAVIYHTIGTSTEINVTGPIPSDTFVATFQEIFFTLTNQWYSAAPLALALNTDPTLVHSYGYIQAYSVWNQFRGTDDADGNGSGVNVFTGSVLGLTTDWPDIIHKYLMTDTNAQTNDRYFVLISMSQDWRSCIWTAALVECFNTVEGRNYSDPISFKYISE